MKQASCKARASNSKPYREKGEKEKGEAGGENKNNRKGLSVRWRGSRPLIKQGPRSREGQSSDRGVGRSAPPKEASEVTRWGEAGCGCASRAMVVVTVMPVVEEE